MKRGREREREHTMLPSSSTIEGSKLYERNSTLGKRSFSDDDEEDAEVDEVDDDDDDVYMETSIGGRTRGRERVSERGRGRRSAVDAPNKKLKLDEEAKLVDVRASA